LGLLVIEGFVGAANAQALGGEEKLASFASKNSVRHNSLNSFI
jgi:hypothetical protein